MGLRSSKQRKIGSQSASGRTLVVKTLRFMIELCLDVRLYGFSLLLYLSHHIINILSRLRHDARGSCPPSRSQPAEKQSLPCPGILATLCRAVWL